jgi:hypothetical protein
MERKVEFGEVQIAEVYVDDQLVVQVELDAVVLHLDQLFHSVRVVLLLLRDVVIE